MNTIRDDLTYLASIMQTVKSIQRGTISMTGSATTATATLSPAVVTTLTELRFGGVRSNYDGASQPGRVLTTTTLTNTTTVTATRGTAQDISSSTIVTAWEITEFEDV